MNCRTRLAVAATLLFSLVVCHAGDIIHVDRFEDGFFAGAPVAGSSVSTVLPLGQTDGARHVLPASGLQMVLANAGGTVQVRAVARGEVALVQRSWSSLLGTFVYHVYVQHSDRFTSHVSGLTSLAPGILAGLNNAWVDLAPNHSAVAPGEAGQPARFMVEADDALGLAGHPLPSWTLGLIDADRRSRPLGRGLFRFPSFREIAAALGVPLSRAPISGHPVINAACPFAEFPGELRESWRARMPAADCGAAHHDVAETLQGNWFNPSLDAAPAHPVDLGVAALVFVPSALQQDSYYVTFGRDSDYAQLDPNGQHRSSTVAMTMTVEAGAPGVNTSPLEVEPDTGVHCFDLHADLDDGHYTRLFVRMDAADSVRVHWDPTERPLPTCAGALPSFDADQLDAHFVR